jgi:uncharacterized protein with HEPN domain
MPRSVAAYSADIVDACDAVQAVLVGVSLTTYHDTRALRSSVEREFILIGEALAVIRRQEPEAAQGISPVRKIVGFRNLLAHEYAAVDDETVFGFAIDDLPLLRRVCAARLENIERGDQPGT